MRNKEKEEEKEKHTGAGQDSRGVRPYEESSGLE
jgi:hypothetical protein